MGQLADEPRRFDQRRSVDLETALSQRGSFRGDVFMPGEKLDGFHRLSSVSKKGGAAEGFFADLVEQRSGEKVDRVVAERETERGESQQIAQIVGDLFKIRRAGAGWVVTILARCLDGNLPLAADGFYMGVAEEVHRHHDFFSGRREEGALWRPRPGRIKGRVGDASEVCEEREVSFSVGAQGALGNQWGGGGWRGRASGGGGMKSPWQG